MQGWRISMEDSHATVLDLRKINAEDLKAVEEGDSVKKDAVDSELAPTPAEDRISFFAVYDGHGGKFYKLAAELC